MVGEAITLEAGAACLVDKPRADEASIATLTIERNILHGVIVIMYESQSGMRRRIMRAKQHTQPVRKKQQNGDDANTQHVMIGGSFPVTSDDVMIHESTLKCSAFHFFHGSKLTMAVKTARTTLTACRCHFIQ